MSEIFRSPPTERDAEQAISALKKGSHLLKYGRRGKPKFYLFKLSDDESQLIWCSEKEERQLKLNTISKIIPGQRTAIFQRHPRPEKEYQSFSLIYNDRSLDLICKDKDEAEIWFVGLKALISSGNNTRKRRTESRSGRVSSEINSPHGTFRKVTPMSSPFHRTITTIHFQKNSEDSHQTSESFESPTNELASDFTDDILYSDPSKVTIECDISMLGVDNQNERASSEIVRISSSSAVSSSSHGSGHGDFDAMGDVFIWGEGIGNGILGGGLNRVEISSSTNIDSSQPKALIPASMLDVQSLACGSRHAILATKKGEAFSWGEELGGRLGHGVDSDVPQPKLIESLTGLNIELLACGEYHTCAVTISGELYTWGDGAHNIGVLGYSCDIGHWTPKRVSGQLEGLRVSSISCGPWHTTVVTSSGKLFTFGEGTFGALGHGDRTSINIPKEVEALKGLRTIQAACGVWHTAAVIELLVGSPDSTISTTLGKVFTWGDGDKGRLGHGNREPQLLPVCVDYLNESNFRQVTCGHDITVVLSNSGRVYTMGSNVYGQLGNPKVDGRHPTCVEGKLLNSFVVEIACGSYHVAVLTSQAEVYTWGRGANGRLGHGDTDDCIYPTLVESLKDKQVKSIICGSNFTAAICLRKCASSSDQAICSGCRLPFSFRRKRHNCYNCGSVFCKACSTKKSLKACLAPNINKLYRVCDGCYTKLKKDIENEARLKFTKKQNENLNQVSICVSEKGNLDPKQQGQFFRLSSIDSSKKNKEESNNNILSQLFNVSSPWSTFQSSKSTVYVSGNSKKTFSASVPSSRLTSRATSPISRSPSHQIDQHNCIDTAIPPRTSSDYKNKTDGNSNHENTLMQLQVGDLTKKSHFLESELERITMQLRDATAKTVEESAKYMAAKEEIESLKSQLKDIVRRAYPCKDDGSAVSNDSSILDHFQNENISNLINSQKPDFDPGHSNPSCNGIQIPKEADLVEQVEQGVYITISTLPDGEKYLKKVRFSRKRFTEKQAEKWWGKNRLRIQEEYGVLASEKIQ